MIEFGTSIAHINDNVEEMVGSSMVLTSHLLGTYDKLYTLVELQRGHFLSNR